MQDQDDTASQALRQADLDAAGLDQAEHRLLEFARLLTENPARTSDESVQALRDVGWNDAQIAEAVYVVGLFAMLNRVADAFGLDDSAYGRELAGKPPGHWQDPEADTESS